MPIRTSRTSTTRVERLALVAFVFSGAAGLIAEVAWIRRASLVFGSTTYALSTILGVFFFGLAAGNAVFGAWSRRVQQPLRVYAWLELGLGLLVVLTLPLFGILEDAYGFAFRRWSELALALDLARVALVATVVLLPAFCMGGTLPLVCQHFVRQPGRIATPVGLLYAANTLGAAAGCMAAGFVLIPALGVTRTVVCAGLVDMLLGVILLLAMQRRPAAALVARPSPPPARRRLARRVQLLVPAVFCISGFVALGSEVLWTRFLALVVRNTVLTYTITLTVVLVGIVLGSLCSAAIADRVRRRVLLLGTLLVLQALIVWGVFHMPAPAWQGLGDRFWTYMLLLLPPAFLSGAAFPLAIRLVIDQPADAGVVVGRMTALNTLGGISGSLCVGFVTLPHLGIEPSARLLTAINLAAGIAVWLALGTRPRLAAMAAAFAVTAWWLVPSLTRTRVPQDFLAPRESLVDFAEGRESNLAVVRRDAKLVLEIDRWWQGQDAKTHQVVAAHVPMLLHASPQEVLVVGVGAGQTPRRFLMYDITRLDCVDIEPAVFDLVQRHFDSAWMQDPRVRLLGTDGRNYLTHARRQYDVISIEVGQLFRPGIATFYTADFYARARSRLRPGGVLSQFVPLSFVSPEQFASIVATFRHVFPVSVLWYNTSELLLLGVNDSDIGIDCRRLQLLAQSPAVHDDLRYAHWGGPAEWLNTPAAFLAGFLCGPEGLAQIAAGAALYRDDRPVLEYAARRVREAETRETEIVPILRAALDPFAGPRFACVPDSTRQRAARIRELNVGDMLASAALRQVDAAKHAANWPEAERLLRVALAANPRNATALRLMGDAHLLQGRFAASVPFFEGALALRSDPSAARGLGFAKHRLGDVEGAIVQYRTALGSAPDDAEAHNLLGAALVAHGQLDEALRHFERAVQLRPDAKEAAENLARTRAALARRSSVP